MPPLSLPPAYTAAVIEADRDPVLHALGSLGRGVEDGLLILADRQDRLELALVAEPEGDAASAERGFYAFATATADMLAAALPPMLAVALIWPATIMVDGSAIGRLRLWLGDADAGQAHPWMILGLSLRIRSDIQEYSHSDDGASLGDCGAGDLRSFALAESVARHFLFWLDRLDREGFGPVQQSWNARCHERLRTVTLPLPDGHREGRVQGIDAEGRLGIGSERLALADYLAGLA